MKLKVFFAVFVLSLPFWWAVNVSTGKLENFLFWQEIAKNPQLLTARINSQIFEEKLRREKIIRNPAAEELEINARAAISVFTNNNFENQKILFQKNGNGILPIASLAKLMTAYVVLENYDIDQTIDISEKAVFQSEDFGNFKITESFKIKDLLYSLLMESSNDAAYALTEIIGEDAFAVLMNLEAKNILGKDNQNTIFGNAAGLDPKKNGNQFNFSTAEDLAKITVHLLKKQPFIWEILSQQDFDLYSSDGVFHHKIISTNELLGKIPGIIGGKTGETQQAGGCLILILKPKNNQGFLINVLLGSDDRFGEMEKLIDWVNLTYGLQTK